MHTCLSLSQLKLPFNLGLELDWFCGMPQGKNERRILLKVNTLKLSDIRAESMRLRLRNDGGVGICESLGSRHSQWCLVTIGEGNWKWASLTEETACVETDDHVLQKVFSKILQPFYEWMTAPTIANVRSACTAVHMIESNKTTQRGWLLTVILRYVNLVPWQKDSMFHFQHFKIWY